jgi:hypothetical protein
MAYVWTDEHLPEAWTFDDLTPTDLAHYVALCGSWRERYEQHRV